eukprot:m.308498 g.308498  ORF g.308498 m.308498 type:complete len:1100 (+) comp15940_c0_seq1:550-3849(+)
MAEWCRRMFTDGTKLMRVSDSREKLQQLGEKHLLHVPVPLKRESQSSSAASISSASSFGSNPPSTATVCSKNNTRHVTDIDKHVDHDHQTSIPCTSETTPTTATKHQAAHQHETHGRKPESQLSRGTPEETLPLPQQHPSRGHESRWSLARFRPSWFQRRVTISPMDATDDSAEEDEADHAGHKGADARWRRASSQVNDHPECEDGGVPARKRSTQPSFFGVDSDAKFAMKFFGSYVGLEAEIERQELIRQTKGFVIHPYSSFRWYWDLLMVLLLLFTVVSVPVVISFFREDPNSAWFVTSCIVDTLFFVDIVLNFRTGYIATATDTSHKIVLEPRNIAKRYLKSWFAVDLISTLPLDYIMSTTADTDAVAYLHASRALKFLRITKLLSLLRLLRVTKVFRLFEQWEEVFQFNTSLLRMSKLILFMLLMAHWSGCLQFLAVQLAGFPEDSWVAINNLVDSPAATQYTWALFKALSHMLCIGYGRYPPRTVLELWLTILSMLIGATFYAVFIGQISSITLGVDSAGRIYREKLAEVSEYLRARRVPGELKRRVFDYYDYRWAQQKYFDETEILEELSHGLRVDIIKHNCEPLVQSLPFLREADPELVEVITTKVEYHVAMPGEWIIKANTFGSEMYLLQYGCVHVLTADGRHVSTLDDGSFFGEMSLLRPSRRTASVRAVTACKLYTLSKHALDEVLEMFPHLKLKLERTAHERYGALRNMQRMKRDSEASVESGRGSRHYSQSKAQPSHGVPLSSLIEEPETSSGEGDTMSRAGKPALSTSPLDHSTHPSDEAVDNEQDDVDDIITGIELSQQGPFMASKGGTSTQAGETGTFSMHRRGADLGTRDDEVPSRRSRQSAAHRRSTRFSLSFPKRMSVWRAFRRSTGDADTESAAEEAETTASPRRLFHDRGSSTGHGSGTTGQGRRRKGSVAVGSKNVVQIPVEDMDTTHRASVIQDRQLSQGSQSRRSTKRRFVVSSFAGRKSSRVTNARMSGTRRGSVFLQSVGADTGMVGSQDREGWQWVQVSPTAVAAEVRDGKADGQASVEPTTCGVALARTSSGPIDEGQKGRVPSIVITPATAAQHQQLQECTSLESQTTVMN